MRKEDQIYQDIRETAGIVDNRIDGQYVMFSVKPMYEKINKLLSRTQPSGRFQINVSVPGERRDRIFRTKVKDGSYDILSVVDAIKSQARILKVQQQQEDTRAANKNAAEALREKYKFKSRCVSAYVGGQGSFCAPAPVEGKLTVQINFGSVDPAIAEKIMAFALSLEA